MKKFLKGFYYAWKGISYTFSTQVNFRIQLAVAVLVTAMSFYLNISRIEWLWVLSAIALVLIAEMVNTAAERLVDLISPGFNPLAGRVKDIMAGLVLIISILAAIIGMLIFIPKILHAS